MKDSAHQLAVERIIDRWNSGARPDAAGMLETLAELAEDHSAVLELAYEEYRIKRSLGETIEPAEFCGRFPGCAGELREMIAVHQLLVDEHPSLLDAIQGAVVTSEPQWPSVGSEWEGLRLIEELGRGAVARVFLAEEMSAGNRRVSVKVTPQESREPALQGPLSHANIMPLFSVRKSSDARFQILIMPYWGRATLCDVIRDARAAGPEPTGASVVARASAEHSRDQSKDERTRDGDRRAPSIVAETLRIGIDIARALEYAHRQGVYHCDLKPANVLVSAVGRILLIDFNLAATRSDSHGAPRGTLPYMSPERLAAFNAFPPTSDPPPKIQPVAADIFSLAVLMYELLTGRLPYGEPDRALPLREQASELWKRQQSGPPAVADPPISNLERRLFELLLECLEIRVDRRLADAAEFARRAEAILRDEAASSATSPGPAERPPIRRTRWLATTCLALLAGLLAQQIVRKMTPRPLTRETLADRWNSVRAPIARFRVWMAPEEPSGWALLGDAQLAGDKPQVALAYYDRAKRLGYDEASLHNNTGLADMLLRRHKSAESALTDAIRRDPRLRQAYVNRAESNQAWLVQLEESKRGGESSDLTTRLLTQIHRDQERVRDLGGKPPLPISLEPVKLAPAAD